MDLRDVVVIRLLERAGHGQNTAVGDYHRFERFVILVRRYSSNIIDHFHSFQHLMEFHLME